MVSLAARQHHKCLQTAMNKSRAKQRKQSKQQCQGVAVLVVFFCFVRFLFLPPPFFFSSFPLQWFRLSPHLECCLHDLAIFVVKKQHKPGQAPLVLYSIKTRGVCKCVCVSVCVSVLVCVSLSTSLSLSRPLSLDLSTSSASPGSGEQVLLATKKKPHNIILP